MVVATVTIPVHRVVKKATMPDQMALIWLTTVVTIATITCQVADATVAIACQIVLKKEATPDQIPLMIPTAVVNTVTILFQTVVAVVTN